MENFMHGELFKKAKSINPDLTEEQFEEKRKEALSRPGGEHNFTDVGGGVIMDTANLSEQDKESILEEQRNEGEE